MRVLSARLRLVIKCADSEETFVRERLDLATLMSISNCRGGGRCHRGAFLSLAIERDPGP
jgi:ferredoxin